MRRINRRVLLTTCITLLAGCTSDNDSDEDPTTTASPPTAEYRSPLPTESGQTTTPEPDTETPTSTPKPITPDLTIPYGEPFHDETLEIIVDEPIIETTFYYEGPRHQNTPPDSNGEERHYEMPEGSALAFAPVTLTNHHDEEYRWLSTPSFYLQSGQTRVKEAFTFDHPDIEGTVSRRRLGRIDDLYFQATHGLHFNPGMVFEMTIMFIVSDEARPDECDVLYDPYLGTKFTFSEGKRVAWTT